MHTVLFARSLHISTSQPHLSPLNLHHKTRLYFFLVPFFLTTPVPFATRS